MTRIVAASALTTTKTKSQVQALMTDITPTTNKVFRFDGPENYMVKRTTQSSATFEDNPRPAFIPGHNYSQAQIDAYFPNPTITSINPSTALPAAGGTVVTVTGQNLGGITGITFGGTAGTSFVQVSDQQVKITTPAKAAGTYNVATTGAPSGTDATLTNGATFV